jgi:D-alanine-D-alanine ligase
MKKTRVLVLAGGQSGEHEVSINSARSVLQALPTADFDVTSIVVSKEGRWLSLTESSEALRLGSAPNSGELVLHAAKLAQSFDVVFPILHGPNGEDGTVQGLLKLAGLPYVGSGVLGSALCMDKVMAKAVTATLGIPQVPYQLVTRAEYFHQPEATTSNVLARLSALNFPVFVKPANLGSSVGISKARSTEELKAALSLAFQHDRRVIVEAATADKPRELEVGILGNDHPQASVVGELSFDSEYYDYDTKYTEGKAQMHIPAKIPPQVAEQARTLALQAFRALDCAGLARVDFFYLERTGELLLNEVNTMPGFTSTSMYPELWRASGVTYSELVSKLIHFALEAR